MVLIQSHASRRESVAVLVAAPYLLEYFGRSEYVPCTEARAGSLFRRLGVRTVAGSPFFNFIIFCFLSGLLSP